MTIFLIEPILNAFRILIIWRKQDVWYFKFLKLRWLLIWISWIFTNSLGISRWNETIAVISKIAQSSINIINRKLLAEHRFCIFRDLLNSKFVSYIESMIGICESNNSIKRSTKFYFQLFINKLDVFMIRKLRKYFSDAE